MTIKKGTTRWVILTKNYAWKFPSMRSYPEMLKGLLCNKNEQAVWKYRKEFNYAEHLCPIVYANMWGWLIVMPRAKELSEKKFLKLDKEKLNYRFPFNEIAEWKRDSLGKLKGKIVFIDYGD